jgi:predicted dehydrogenase
LGAGNIARRFAASLAHEPRAELVAASCRTSEKAQAFLDATYASADARAYAGHDALIADDQVDAIYLALPHALHRDWAIAALHAKKAVLCEKPACISAAQMREIADVARAEGCLFMEAMKPRFTPTHEQVWQALDQVGKITSVEATLCNDMLGMVEGTGSYHMTPGPGAGVLLDCGIYCASWIDELCDGEPELLHTNLVTKNGIDVYVDARYRMNSVDVRLECAFDRAKRRTCTIVGTRGRIVVDELHRPQHAMVYPLGAEPREIDAPYEVDDFFGEIHHVVSLIEQGATESPVMSLDASIRCARILDAARG